jgi:hypothetical protein
MLLEVDPEDDPKAAQEGAHAGLHFPNTVRGQPGAVGEEVAMNPTLVALQDLHRAG